MTFKVFGRTRGSVGGFRRVKGESGFTLAEAVVSLTVVAILALGLAPLIVSSVELSSKGEVGAASVGQVQKAVEQIRATTTCAALRELVAAEEVTHTDGRRGSYTLDVIELADQPLADCAPGNSSSVMVKAISQADKKPVLAEQIVTVFIPQEVGTDNAGDMGPVSEAAPQPATVLQLNCPTAREYTAPLRGFSGKVIWSDGTTYETTASSTTARIPARSIEANVNYTLTLEGNFNNIYTTASGTSEAVAYRSQECLREVSDWSVNTSGSFDRAFNGATNLTSVADPTKLSVVRIATYMFHNAGKFNSDISDWDMSQATNVHYMFSKAESFNQPIGKWDTSNFTDITAMFTNATSFNQDLSNWKTDKVTKMTSLFYGATNFNGNLSTWKTSGVTDMSSVFSGAARYNQPMVTSGDVWNTSKVTTMESTFSGATDFTQLINSWNTSNVESMKEMFKDAANYNRGLHTWNVAKVTERTNFDLGAVKWAAANKPKFK